MSGRGIVMKNVWWPLLLLAWKSLDHCWLGVLGVKFPCVWLIYIYRWFFLLWWFTCQWWPKDIRQQQHTAWCVPDSITRVPYIVYHVWHHIHIECQTPFLTLYIACLTPYIYRVPNPLCMKSACHRTYLVPRVTTSSVIPSCEFKS